MELNKYNSDYSNLQDNKNNNSEYSKYNILGENTKDDKSLSCEIEKNLEDIFSNYFDVYINKLDYFTNQLDLAEVALKAYNDRIKRVVSKMSVVRDFFEENSVSKEEFILKQEKLSKIDAKLSKVEIRTQKLVSNIVDFENKIRSAKIGNTMKISPSLNTNNDEKIDKQL